MRGCYNFLTGGMLGVYPVSEFDNLTKYHVWKGYDPENKRFKRWQSIMRRASRFSKLPNGQGFLEIDGQRTFKCAYCDRWADFADYESLGFFCFDHAIWYLKQHGQTPVFMGRIKDCS